MVHVDETLETCEEEPCSTSTPRKAGNRLGESDEHSGMLSVHRNPLHFQPIIGPLLGQWKRGRESSNATQACCGRNQRSPTSPFRLVSFCLNSGSASHVLANFGHLRILAHLRVLQYVVWMYLVRLWACRCFMTDEPMWNTQFAP